MKLHSNIYGWEYVWEEFADEKGGTAIREYSEQGGGGIIAVEVAAPQLGATVSITPSSAGTCMVGSFVPTDGFVFRLFVERLIHRVEKVFGLQDITTGDKEFDRQYVIQSNDAARIKELLSDPAVRKNILEASVDSIAVINGTREKHHSHLPDSHHLLMCDWHYFMDKHEQLEAGYQVVTGVLERLNQCSAIQLGVQVAQANPVPQPEQVVAPVRLHSPLLGR